LRLTQKLEKCLLFLRKVNGFLRSGRAIQKLALKYFMTALSGVLSLPLALLPPRPLLRLRQNPWVVGFLNVISLTLLSVVTKGPESALRQCAPAHQILFTAFPPKTPLLR
jgi:hypothetical protein